jgi:GTP 3',8-cyclase
MKDSCNREINYLRLALTRACNLRCDYCMPTGQLCVARQDELSFDQFMAIIKGGAHMGIKKVRLTGGEPLLYPQLIRLVESIKSTPGIESVHITTNGTLLKGLASDLVAAGLDSINISMDTLDGEKYKRITRGGSLESVLAGIKALDKLNFHRIKINTVLMKGVNDDEVESLIDWAVQNGKILRFIEMMPIGEGQAHMDSRFLLVDEIIKKFPFFHGREPHVEGTSFTYPVEGSKGEIGFITPLRGHFCDRCNKIRINSLGELRQCLMSKETISLKDVLFDMELLVQRMKDAVEGRPSSGNEKGFQDFPMYTIGG